MPSRELRGLGLAARARTATSARPAALGVDRRAHRDRRRRRAAARSASTAAGRRAPCREPVRRRRSSLNVGVGSGVGCPGVGVGTGGAAVGVGTGGWGDRLGTRGAGVDQRRHCALLEGARVHALAGRARCAGRPTAAHVATIPFAAIPGSIVSTSVSPPWSVSSAPRPIAPTREKPQPVTFVTFELATASVKVPPPAQLSPTLSATIDRWRTRSRPSFEPRCPRRCRSRDLVARDRRVHQRREVRVGARGRDSGAVADPGQAVERDRGVVQREVRGAVDGAVEVPPPSAVAAFLSTRLACSDSVP